MQLDDYLTERSEGGPSGENLEYDGAFTALLLAAQPVAERQAGTEILAAEDPDFKEVTEKAIAVLERSHDLRAAVYLAEAQLALAGLEGFAGPVGYVRQCLQDYWETCHPVLDADDDNDPTMRINSVLGLAGADTILRKLRLAPLTESPTFGRFSLRDIAIAEGESPAPEGMTRVPDTASVQAAFKDTKADLLRARLDTARQLLEDAKAISAVFDEQTPGDGPDLEPLIRMVKRLVTRLADAVGEPEAVAEAGAEEGGEAVAAAAPAASGGVPGAISSPNDVRAALDRIITYYSTHEPSSPLPILLHRARRLVGADFMTIMKDMAPSGVENVMSIGGIEEEED